MPEPEEGSGGGTAPRAAGDPRGGSISVELLDDVLVGTAGRQRAERRLTNSVGMAFVLVPAGKFHDGIAPPTNRATAATRDRFTKLSSVAPSIWTCTTRSLRPLISR